MKRRILNARLAAIVASIRHGEMLFIADAGSGTSSKALYPLSPDVEYLDLEAVTGSPSFQDIVSTLVEVGDFEAAIVTDLMPQVNKKDYSFLVGLLGEENITQVNYIPEYYQLRDRCKAVSRPAITGCMRKPFSSPDILRIRYLWNGWRKD